MEEQELGLDHYASQIWRRKWVVLGIALLITGLALGYGLRRAAIYEAEATVLIEREEGLGRLLEITESFFADRGILTQMELIKSRDVLERAVVDLGEGEEISAGELERKARSLRGLLRVTQIGSTDLVRVIVESEEPALAQAGANAVAEAYLDQSIANRVEAVNRALEASAIQLAQLEGNSGAVQLYEELTKAQTEIALAKAAGQIAGIQIVDRALLPTNPVGFPLWQIVIAGLVVGVVVGSGGALALNPLDKKLRSDEDVKQALDIPLMGQIPHGNPDSKRELRLEDDPKSPFAEALRVLRTNLQFAAVDGPLRSLLITSPGPDEGKTTIAVNLAKAFALEGSSVLLIDADLRKPSIHNFFNSMSGLGLSELLLETNSALVLDEESNFMVIGTGPLPPNPAELLGSNRMKKFLSHVEDIFDLVVIDGPPVLALADALLLGKQVDGVLLLVRDGATSKKAAIDAIDSLSRVETKVLGAVLNDIKRTRNSYYYQYYNRYARKTE